MNLEEIKYCKYCNNELKKIVYEIIIEPDKSNEFERYYCKKCLRMFWFREPLQKKIKKTIETKSKKTNPNKQKQQLNIWN